MANKYFYYLNVIRYSGYVWASKNTTTTPGEEGLSATESNPAGGSFKPLWPLVHLPVRTRAWYMYFRPEASAGQYPLTEYDAEVAKYTPLPIASPWVKEHNTAITIYTHFSNANITHWTVYHYDMANSHQRPHFPRSRIEMRPTMLPHPRAQGCAAAGDLCYTPRHVSSQLMTSQWKSTTTAINPHSQNVAVDTTAAHTFLHWTLTLTYDPDFQSQVSYGITYKKVQVALTRLPSVAFRSWSRFLAASLQVTWVINPAVGCHYFPPGLQLLLQPLRGLLPILLLGEQRHEGCEQFV